MAESIITVGHTEKDEGGNLWVSPAGGGERVKIAAKRSHLFPLFQQGKSVMLDWQTYLNRQYVADAKEVAGEAVRVIRTPADLPGPKATPEPLKSEPSNKPLPYQVEIEARARNTALMQACELTKTSLTKANLTLVYPIDEVLLTADRFYQWLIKPSPDALELQISPVKAESSAVAPAEEDETPITAEQLKHLTSLIKESSISLVELGKWMKERGWKVTKLENITQGQYNKICQAFKEGKP